MTKVQITESDVLALIKMAAEKAGGKRPLSEAIDKAEPTIHNWCKKPLSMKVLDVITLVDYIKGNPAA